MEHYAGMGIKTIVNLRGANNLAPYIFEVEACRDLGLELIDIPLSARRAAPRERMLELVDLLINLPTPFLLHCKSGADRTGLASALYLMLVHNVPVAQAKRQLTIRHVHLNFTKTGILDYIMWVYEQRNAHSAIALRDWIATEYDHERISQEFAKVPFWKRMKL
jgi:protein tyrosine/serine phosphatase